MKQLSIIIPLYNCEDYICQAIDSILIQKDLDYELIVVNDGSTDNSLSNILKYGDAIKIITITNSGASAARNIGLRESSGKYVMFLDADDYLSDCYVCKKVIGIIESKRAQMGMFLYKYLNNTSGKYTKVISYPEELLETEDNRNLICGLISNGVFPASPCFKIIERDFLLNRNLFFIEGTTAEDIEWFSRLLIEIECFCVINNDSYIYRKNIQNSVTGSLTIDKCNNQLNMISISAECVKIVRERWKKEALFSALAYQYCILLSNSYLYKNNMQLTIKIKSLEWLLAYDLFPNVKYVKYLYRLMGYRMTAFLLHNYSTYYSKSSQ